MTIIHPNEKPSYCLGYHTAPELYRNDAFDSSVDAYSFGFILYEVSKFLFVPDAETTGQGGEKYWWLGTFQFQIVAFQLASHSSFVVCVIIRWLKVQ